MDANRVNNVYQVSCPSLIRLELQVPWATSDRIEAIYAVWGSQPRRPHCLSQAHETAEDLNEGNSVPFGQAIQGRDVNLHGPALRIDGNGLQGFA